MNIDDGMRMRCNKSVEQIVTSSFSFYKWEEILTG